MERQEPVRRRIMVDRQLRLRMLEQRPSLEAGRVRHPADPFPRPPLRVVKVATPHLLRRPTYGKDGVRLDRVLRAQGVHVIAHPEGCRKTEQGPQRVGRGWQVPNPPRRRLVVRILHEHGGPAHVVEAQAGAAGVADSATEEQHQPILDADTASERERLTMPVREGCVRLTVDRPPPVERHARRRGIQAVLYSEALADHPGAVPFAPTGRL
jgi:hypothetical protein